MFVLGSPVGDYFGSNAKPLKLLVADNLARSTEQLGSVKTGGNYAAALRPTLAAKQQYGVDQVLFCPNGDVQETGTANFMLINDGSIITKPLHSSFLHGITRDSLLTLAPGLGYEINERDFSVDDLLAWVPSHEAALSGTAAMLMPVGTLVFNGEEITVHDGKAGANTARLRQALQAIQYGDAPDTHNWLSVVE